MGLQIQEFPSHRWQGLEPIRSYSDVQDTDCMHRCVRAAVWQQLRTGPGGALSKREQFRVFAARAAWYDPQCGDVTRSSLAC